MEADESSGIRLRRHDDTIALVSAPEAAPYVERLLGLDTPPRLSKAALETLAVIVYHQPVTRDQIERVRGVGASGVIRSLRARDLIAPSGRLDTPGQPLLWSVTPRFLDHFGLSALDSVAAPGAAGASCRAGGAATRTQRTRRTERRRMTFVTVLTVELLIFESASLKEKRAVIRQVMQRTRNKFPVAAAEVESQNDPSRATLAFAAIASDFADCPRHGAESVGVHRGAAAGLSGGYGVD